MYTVYVLSQGQWRAERTVCGLQLAYTVAGVYERGGLRVCVRRAEVK